MSPRLAIADIESYLTTTGWRRLAASRRTASIWSSTDGHEVLLPARDGMGDGDLRIRELLAVLTRTEDRPPGDIAEEIDSPLTDIQTYRLAAAGDRDGLIPLAGGVRALLGVRQLLDSAGRACLEGPHVLFRGGTPREVRTLLAGCRLGSSGGLLAGRPGGDVGSGDGLLAEGSRSGSGIGTASAGFRVHVPVEGPVDGDPLARAVVVQLHDAVRSASAAAAEASGSGDLTRFDDVVTAGVSANLCDALSLLGGDAGSGAFEIGFSWARGLPSPLPATTVEVPAGRAKVLAAAAKHLRGLNFSGDASIVGLIESLHDDTQRSDRWRIKVRGDVAGSRGVASRRTLWVRLDSRSAYDLAIAAHREQHLVRADGTLAVQAGRLELLTPGTSFTPFPDPPP